MYYIHLTIIGTFGGADVPQRLINKSLYPEILLLQKFNAIGGKVLKPGDRQRVDEIKYCGSYFFQLYHLFNRICKKL